MNAASVWISIIQQDWRQKNSVCLYMRTVSTVYVPHNWSYFIFNEHVIHLDKTGFTENTNLSFR